MTQPRLLMFAAELPWPLDVGQKMVTYNDLTRLSEVFDIDVVAYVDRRADPQALLDPLSKRLPTVRFHPVSHDVHTGGGLTAKAPQITRALISGRPYPVVKFTNRAYLETASRLASDVRPDLLYLDHVHGAETAVALGDSMPATPLVYRAHDALYETLESFANQLGALARPIGALHSRQSRSYERKLWKRAAVVASVTRRLERMILDQEPEIADRVMYWPVPVPLLPERPGPPTASRSVLYVGTVTYPPNLEGLRWFIDRCWDHIRAEEPDATFDVIGRGSETLDDADRGIHGHGYVDDVEAFYDNARAIIVPLFSGSGIRIKILDAFNRSRPVVSTKAGYAGLEVADRQELLVAEDPTSFASAVVELLADPSVGDGLASAGRRFLMDHHDPRASESAVQRLLDLVKDS